MVDDPVTDLPREVQPRAVVLEVLDDPQRLLGMPEGPTEERRECLLAEVAEGRMPQVVA